MLSDKNSMRIVDCLNHRNAILGVFGQTLGSERWQMREGLSDMGINDYYIDMSYDMSVRLFFDEDNIKESTCYMSYEENELYLVVFDCIFDVLPNNTIDSLRVFYESLIDEDEKCFVNCNYNKKDKYVFSFCVRNALYHLFCAFFPYENGFKMTLSLSQEHEVGSDDYDQLYRPIYLSINELNKEFCVF